jgi:hypothetical protein
MISLAPEVILAGVGATTAAKLGSKSSRPSEKLRTAWACCAPRNGRERGISSRVARDANRKTACGPSSGWVHHSVQGCRPARMATAKKKPVATNVRCWRSIIIRSRGELRVEGSGAWANVQGQATAQLQLSNQSR